MKAAILGTGYVAAELARILCRHPGLELVEIQGRSGVGQSLQTVYPNLDLSLQIKELDVGVGRRVDLVFTALPHGTSMKYVPAILEGGAKVVDMSADFRLNPAVFEKVYGVKHECPELRGVYGLTELHRQEIKKARLVANPGCYPTPVILALAPLVSEGIVDLEHIVITALSGTSGAGHQPQERTHHPICGSNLQVYSATTHRHVPEINQELGRLAGREVEVHFVPHLVPIVRGILATASIFLKEERGKEELLGLYRKFYRGEKFVRIREGLPQVNYVTGSNFCDIGLETLGRWVVVVSVVDNLVKGAAGQAIQNANLMLGLPEEQGLDLVPLRP
ncbi:MAG: N-acetyl-gamma-glutamyl-phosphate reductase [Candidatus Hadarchaeales archaeon]